MTHHLKRALAEVRHVPKTVQLVWSATARWTAVWLVLLLVQGLLPAAALYLTKHVVDGLAAALKAGAGWSGVQPVFGPATLLGLVALAMVLSRVAATWVESLQAGLLQDHISGLIHEKSANVQMAFYDFPEFYDHLHRAREEASYRPERLLNVLGGLLQNGVTLVAVALVLIPYGGWRLPALLLLSTAPTLYLVVGNSLRRQEWQKRATTLERKAWYYDQLLTARETAAEMRVYHLAAPFASEYQELRHRLRDEQLRLVRREGIGELIALSIGLAVAAAGAGWVLSEALNGRITAGALAMFYAAFVQGQAVMRSALSNAGQLFVNSLFLGNLFAFLALDAEDVPASPLRAAAPSLLRRGIRFEGVRFHYPGSLRPALSDFSLEIPAGRTVAIVGPNGAGKSTVLKLLCRFYDQQAGRIVIDGEDIRKRTPSELRRSLSVLFQDPVRYSATVHDSVALACTDSLATPRVRAAVHAAGADEIVRRLPQQFATLLGKEFDNGVELSGGEWQRLALARALMRDAPILLLDEPTSAMDSWAEIEWFDRLRRATEGRTVLIITHRFTTAMRADVIHVMDQGRIVESGSHQELLELDGRYAYSWDRQTEPALATIM